MALISELVEVIHLINTKEEGRCFASETLETLVGNVKCQENTALKVFEKLKTTEEICKKLSWLFSQEL